MKSLLFLLLLLPFSLHAQDYDCSRADRMCPPEQPESVDPDFLTFWKELESAVEAKSWAQLKPLLSEEIMFGSMADDPGLENFARYYGLNETPPDPDLWQSLGNLMRIGYTQDGDDPNSYWMPYFSRGWDHVNYDPFEGYQLITGDNVNVRDAPSLKGKKIGQLHYQIVLADWSEGPEMTLGGETYRWVKIKTVDKTPIEGYVWGKFVHSTFSMRVGFAKGSGDSYKIGSIMEGE